MTLTGDFDPETITTALGVQPSKAWLKGELLEKTHHERKFSRWSLGSRLDRSASLEDQLRDVLDQSLAFATKLRQLNREYASYIQLVGYFYNGFPGFGLDAKIISQMAELRLGIDCDFYDLSSEAQEDLDRSF